MVSPLHQFSLTQLALGAVFIIVILAVVQRWALQRLNADPADDVDSAAGDKESEILGDVPVRSKVGTPRPRRLQPLSAGREEPATGSPLPAAGTTALAKQTESKPAEPVGKPMGLPPLSPADVVGIGGKTKKPDLVTASADKPAEPVVLPPLSVNLPPLTPATPAAGVAKDLPLVGASTSTPPETKDKPPIPGIEKTADGILAVGQPVSLAPAAASPSAVPAETDDVKKRKTPPTAPVAEPSRSGLVLIPKGDEVAAEAVTAASKSVVPPAEPAKAPEVPAIAAKKEETPAAKPTEPVAPATPKPETKPEPPVKTGWRPRIFLPANLPAAAKPTEEPKVAPVPALPAAPVEAKTPAAVPAVESKTEVKPEVKPETPAVPVPTLPAVKPAEPVVAKAEPVAPAPKEPAKTEPPVPAIKAEEAKPAAPKIAPAQPAPVSAAKTPAPAADDRAKIPASAPKLPAEPAVADKTSAKPAEPSIPVPVPILPSTPVPVAAPSGVSVSTPQPTMAQPESTNTVPANSKASAQLTLGFEITSLQLTPFFKLGAVQLKPLSNVVGLHLIASQTADNPLAAGISFQIDTVELNEASHVRSILLKPLQGGAQPATVPQPKLQVDAVQIGQGGDGAPISITSSAATSTAVQLLATFTIAAMDFTPSFEIGSLRLEPTSNSVLLRLAPSSRPASLDLPPSFEVANVQLGDNAQISGMRLTPGTKVD